MEQQAAVAAGTALALACALSSDDPKASPPPPPPQWMQRVLGVGRGLSHIDTNRGALLTGQQSSGDKQTIADGFGAGRSFEEQLRASQPSDLAKLALQLAEERDAFVARTVLAVGVPGWEEVAPADIIASPFRSGVVKLSARTATANADCVFKLPSNSSVNGAARIRTVHRVLSDAGVASALLASGVDWTVEELGAGRDFSRGRGVEGVDWQWTDIEEGLMCTQGAKLTARLHAAPIDWWPPYRDRLRKLLPLLDNEPDSSPLWIMAAFAEGKNAPVPNAAEQAQLAELMVILPRPVGDVANKLVNVHGDLWDANIIEIGGTHKLMDFESTCVCGAVQDLIHMCHPVLVETYLKDATGQQPTEDECEALLFEARLAEHVHFFVHRAVFGDMHGVPDRTPASDFFEHARRLAAVAEAVRGSKVLRRHVVRGCVPEGEPAIQVDQRQLRPEHEARGATWCWWSAEQLAAAAAKHS